MRSEDRNQSEANAQRLTLNVQCQPPSLELGVPRRSKRRTSDAEWRSVDAQAVRVNRPTSRTSGCLTCWSAVALAEGAPNSSVSDGDRREHDK
jgi:hypothetical protein